MIASCVRSMRSCTIDWLSSSCERSVLSCRRPIKLICEIVNFQQYVRLQTHMSPHLSPSLDATVLYDGEVLIDPEQCVLGEILWRLDDRLHQQQLALELRKGDQRPERTPKFGIYSKKTSIRYSIARICRTSRPTHPAAPWPAADFRTTRAPAPARSRRTARPSGTWSRPDRSAPPCSQT